MDIRTKLILALVSVSLVSMAIFGLAIYQLSEALVTANASQELLDQLFANLLDTGLSVAAFAILFGVVLGILLARRIRSLAEIVDRIRHGELDLRARVDGEDEVALLARSLNEFMDQLSRSGDIFQLGQLRVLVAENHARNRHLLDELLTNWRMHAVLASNGKAAMQAIDAAERQEKPIQLVVLDTDMPEMADLSFLRELATRTRHCPIILLAKDPQSIDSTKLRELGVAHVLPTPVIASDLMQAILEEMGVSAAALDDVPDVLLAKTDARRVLLVEDSDIIAKVTTGFLEKWGHAVTRAADGRDAVELVGEAPFDIVLMDLEMPRMGGIEATRAIRSFETSDRTRLPIVALTARATKEDREQCMAAGMDEYVSKPVDPKMLYRLVNAYPAREGGAIGIDSADLAAAPGEPHAATSPPSSDPLIDWSVARNLTGGDADLLDELIALFPGESSAHLDALGKAIENGDAEATTRAAHTLKSAARFFGAQAVVDCAARIEAMGREQQIDEASELLEELKALTAALVAELTATPPPRAGAREEN